jgi:hypothetical protein
MVTATPATKEAPVGANVGATRANDFPRRANEHGQAADQHPRSRTGLDDAEHEAGNYGSEGWRFEPSEHDAIRTEVIFSGEQAEPCPWNP